MNEEFDKWYEKTYERKPTEIVKRNLHYQMSLKAYEAGQQSAKPKWTSITEKFPQDREEVIVLCSSGRKYPALYLEATKRFYYEGNKLHNVISWKLLQEE